MENDLMATAVGAPALAIRQSAGKVIVIVPAAHRLWPQPPAQTVTIKWGEGGLVLTDLLGQPQVMLTAAQIMELRLCLATDPAIPLLMMDHFGRHRLVGRLMEAQLRNEEATDD